MVADAKGVAADIDETIAAIKGLRARVFGEHRQIEDRRPLSRPGDAPFHQGGGDAGALGRRADVELMQFGRIVGRLAGGQGEINRAELDEAQDRGAAVADQRRSEEHTSELQSLMRSSYAVFCLKKKK